ncbi:MAG TPA: hypothetical protein VL635_20725, partial [Trinickia sp.]|nr:hypothetical protein [Trinickia sp.]
MEVRVLSWAPVFKKVSFLAGLFSFLRPGSKVPAHLTWIGLRPRRSSMTIYSAKNRSIADENSTWLSSIIRWP